MRQLIHSGAVRGLCYVIIMALVSTIAPMPLATPAGAQLMPTYSVGVVDFLNESGVQGELLARLATDAVVVEMGKTNRYDVSITRSQLREQMERLDMHPPLDKLDLLRLGDALSTDAMLEGAIKSVQLAGTGPTRRASVTLVVQMIDGASGEIINGAVQTGESSARVAYTPDDDSLIVEAVNKAAFLCVKTMVDYIIPEATVLVNLGEDQVMLNKGVRDGLKAGMRMIVLREREIIGYIEVRTVDPRDSIAKITKSMRGVQPEDKARAIFEMPTVSAALKHAPLPSSAPPTKKTGARGTISKLAKFLVVAGIVFGIGSLFRGGRGGEDSSSVSASSPMTIRWDPTKYDHGAAVVELQILREDQIYKVLSNPSDYDRGWTSLDETIGGQPYYGDGGASYTVSYARLAANPGDSYTQNDATVNQEPYGTTHRYQTRVLYQQTTGTGEDATTTYRYTPLSNQITATAVEQVGNSDILGALAYDPLVGPTDILVSRLALGLDKFEWYSKDGGDIYYMKVEPVVPGTGPTWQSQQIYETGPTVILPTAQQSALANLLNNAAYVDEVMKWRVYTRHQGDTSSGWVVGEDNRFRIGGTPPTP
ncbi:MAG: hypothetical protein A2Z18_01985 [Armatimonadetes bacterium RBG_16_58_9]|nr:MAG: hypothetical protein A2Z18_01985 [Armatimonadetes bacterium RBG_16_58_9]